MRMTIYKHQPWFKTLTYCVMHLTVAILIAYALTQNWVMALSIGLLEPFVQTFCYRIHEHFWGSFDKRARTELHDAESRHVRAAQPLGV